MEVEGVDSDDNKNNNNNSSNRQNHASSSRNVNDNDGSHQYGETGGGLDTMPRTYARYTTSPMRPLLLTHWVNTKPCTAQSRSQRPLVSLHFATCQGEASEAYTLQRPVE